MEAISSIKLFYSWSHICKGEVWRLVTNFFYFGSLNLDFLFHMYFLVRDSYSEQYNIFRLCLLPRIFCAGNS